MNKFVEKIKTFFKHTPDEVKAYIETHKPEAETVINKVAQEYTELDGQSKLEQAVALFLTLIKVPAGYSLLAAHIVVTAAQNFVQNTYDELKTAGKI